MKKITIDTFVNVIVGILVFGGISVIAMLSLNNWSETQESPILLENTIKECGVVEDVKFETVVTPETEYSRSKIYHYTTIVGSRMNFKIEGTHSIEKESVLRIAYDSYNEQRVNWGGGRGWFKIVQ